MGTPLVKLLLGEIEPIPLAALLYLGSGLGLLMYQLARQLFLKAKTVEAGLAKKDLPWLAVSILAGGVIALFIQAMRGLGAARTSAL